MWLGARVACYARAMSTIPDAAPWERRFRTTLLGFPTWSAAAPDHLVGWSTESGSYQVHAWDARTGERRRLSDEPVGVTEAHPTADGTGVVWLADPTGDEAGRFVVAPWSGGPARPFLDGLPLGWNEGLCIRPDRVAVAISDGDGFGVYVAEPGEPARRLLHSRESLRIGGGGIYGGLATDRAGLSADGTLLALEHAEHGDLLHQALRIVDARTGATVGELVDTGRDLAAACWSPLPGDQRLAIAHERDDQRGPGLWDLTTGEMTPLPTGLRGFVEPVDWWPDGSALLLIELVDGRDRVHRLDLTTMQLETLDTQPGTIIGARVRPDGSVWYRHESGEHPPRILAAGRSTPILEVPAAAPGRRYLDWAFDNPHGDRIHGFLVEPDGPGPHPTMLYVHGGPTWLDLDEWDPWVQALADAGFLVALVNYRGSAGFGRAWRDRLIGDIGRPETEDILAGLDDLIDRGVADPARTAIGGWSWGGYLTLFAAGTHPDRFVAGVAGVPVGDYAAGYEDLSPLLQAYDRALLGGAPSEVPELVADRSPITYVDAVRIPLLILAGENDSRCPLRQVMNYVERLRARGADHELYLFGTGHGSLVIDEKVRQAGLILDFLARRVPGIEQLPPPSVGLPTTSRG